MNALSPAAQTILEDLSLDSLVSTIHEWWTSPGTDFTAFERKVREHLMTIERGAIAVGLRALDVDCEELEIDGRRYRKCPDPSTKKYSCLGGDLTVERNLYRPADGQGRSISPLELGWWRGTGVTEAACKTLVSQRMKRSGMRWAMIGGQGVLTLRSLLQSARWGRGWALLSRSYQPKILAAA